MTIEEARKALLLADDLRLVAAVIPPGPERRKMQCEAQALEEAANKALAN